LGFVIRESRIAISESRIPNPESRVPGFMREALIQSFQNLRANKLRSFLTMFGILWGMISVVVLSATGEGFRRGNDKVLRELGKNIGIRQILLTLDDARAIAAESSMVAVVSPELTRGAVRVKSAYNAAAAQVTGIEPQYQEIRTIELEYGRNFTWVDEEQVSRVAIVGFDMAEQLFGKRHILGENITLNGMPYTVVGKIRKKNQDSNYSGPDNNKIFLPFAAMARDMPRRDAAPGTLSDIIVAPKDWVVDELPRALDQRAGRIEDIDWPLEQNVRAILARRHGFDPADKQAIAMWDTSLQTLMFGRMIGHMKQFFTIVGIVTLLLGGIGVMNIMLVAVKERTREIGVRKALGATTATIQRQFFLEGFFLTLISGGAGMLVALGLCRLVNLAPMPDRFSGMILSWQSGLVALATLVAIGVATSTYPARRAAELPPVEALRFEM
jgi:putative ABC transport system permease protein